MKKILLLICMMGIGIFSVSAKESSEIYYINDNNVEFTKEQYDFFGNMYYDGYQSIMSQSDFAYFDIDLMESKNIETEYSNNNLSRATNVEDINKSLKISKLSAGSNSVITTTLIWNKESLVKSYDVIGARLSNTSLLDTPVTKLISNKGTTNYTLDLNNNSGFGVSVLLSGSNIKVTQTFTVKNGGTVYASYQHAKNAISLANSKKYTISSNGYGKVFLFTGTASSTYDQMNGVSISV